MNKIILKTYSIALFIILSIFILSSCTPTTNKTYNITLNYKDKTEVIEVNDNNCLKDYIEKNYLDDDIEGWYLNGELYDFNNVITSNLTLDAKLVKSTNKYNPTSYDGNGRVVPIYIDSHTAAFDMFFDPLLSLYSYNDKAERLNHQREIENAYNIKIEYIITDWPYSHISTCIEDVKPCLSIGIQWSNKMPECNTKSLYELSDKLNNESNVLDAQVGDFGYNVSTNNSELLLYYDQNIVKQLGLEDPLTLWNEGKWTINYFDEYINTIVNSELFKQNNYSIFNNNVIQVLMGFSAAMGTTLVPSLDNANLSTEQNIKIVEQIKKYTEQGHIGNYYGIFNALFAGNDVKNYFYSFDTSSSNTIRAVPFPIKDEEAHLLLEGNLSSATYKVAQIPANYFYCIPKVETNDDLTKEVLENILYDLVAQYNGPKLFPAEVNVDSEQYAEIVKVINDIKGNYAEEYYHEIDVSECFATPLSLTEIMNAKSIQSMLETENNAIANRIFVQFGVSQNKENE